MASFRAKGCTAKTAEVTGGKASEPGGTDALLRGFTRGWGRWVEEEINSTPTPLYIQFEQYLIYTSYLRVLHMHSQRNLGRRRTALIRQTAQQSQTANQSRAHPGPASKWPTRRGGRQSQRSTQRREKHQTKELNPLRHTWTDPAQIYFLSCVPLPCTPDYVQKNDLWTNAFKKKKKRRRVNQYLYLLIMIKKWILLCHYESWLFHGFESLFPFLTQLPFSSNQRKFGNEMFARWFD